ncbi:type VI secretion system Vgr family protein [Melittangium boletus]|uniref:Uncharacterized protein n=1 Tax=Melittangium boletus DSM 14713 TaxID=1294270 RepID=A0A250ICI6_9BACT|nr:type VI secretion system tip protein TssI/VgrG [Melittangium boletus]ATB28920.1 hypothetical protein MEBOL_002369 [Melittangium boletus DSM 14713]
MRKGFTQDTRSLSLTTPLGKDVLMLQGFQGEEALSRPFQFSLTMHSARSDVDFSRLVGEGVALSLELEGGGERYVHGVVTRIVQAGTFADFTEYVAELRPWLWLLTLAHDSRIFQDKTVPQILRQLFTEQGFTDFRLDLRGRYAPREYCVQHQESTFDFVSRLMEDEGIFYFFEHSRERHTLVLADDPAAHPACPGPGKVKVPGRDPSASTNDALTACTLEQRVISGGHALGDYDFEAPSTRLRAEVKGKRAGPRRYEYPGRFTRQAEGERRGRLRLEAEEVQARVLRGQGRVRWLVPGHRLGVEEHTRADANGPYVVRWVSHSASLEHYANSFEAFPLATPFRPPRQTPRPVATGVQSARVVGESGGEISTDRHGRVKVRFHWDREDQRSCWIRVAQGWAGKGWGQLFLPHVGQEVLITFLDGDPDRPIITGSVYNAEQQVPYPLPAHQTRSTLRGMTPAKGDPNELRLEDKKGAEELYLHAHRDMKVSVEHDSVREVRHNDTLEVQEGDRTVRVARGNEVHEVQGNYTLKVQGNLTLDVQGDLTLKSGRSQLHQARMSLTGKAGMGILHQAGTSLTSIAGMNLTQRAGLVLESSAGLRLYQKSALLLQTDAQLMIGNIQLLQMMKAMPLLLKGAFITMPL